MTAHRDYAPHIHGSDTPRWAITDLQIAEFRLALSRITERYPPDTVAGRLAADVLARYPNPFENADRENDCEPFAIPEIDGLLLGGEGSAS